MPQSYQETCHLILLLAATCHTGGFQIFKWQHSFWIGVTNKLLSCSESMGLLSAAPTQISLPDPQCLEWSLYHLQVIIGLPWGDWTIFTYCMFISVSTEGHCTSVERWLKDFKYRRKHCSYLEIVARCFAISQCHLKAIVQCIFNLKIVQCQERR